jgi:hypothetical protein
MSAAPGLPYQCAVDFSSDPRGSLTNRRKAIGESSTPQPFPPNYPNALFLEPAKDGVQCFSAILDGSADVDLTGTASSSL